MHFPKVPICLNTSDNDLDKEFYIPCLNWATQFDRGVGYFTSGWISKNAAGLAAFASHSGKARWITSPILDEKDFIAISSAPTMQEAAEYFQAVMNSCIDQLANDIEEETLNALGWMIFDDILEFKFAIPCKKLIDGDFHDKFGVFYGDGDLRLSFTGSINDSAKGFSNYESIKVFKSWEAPMEYINSDISRFEKLWNNNDDNLRVLKTDDVIREKLVQLRKGSRPYRRTPDPDVKDPGLWAHQDEALQAFLKHKNGILEMATGTGKTRTALKIIYKLFKDDVIDRVIVTMYGNDLLEQWNKELISGLSSEIQIFKYFDTSYKDFPGFLLYSGKCVLVVSRDADRLKECFIKMIPRIPNVYERVLLIFDEVHGLGSESLVRSLSGMLSPFKYRLGLSATPEREYGEEGNEFILREVGPVIYQFSLEDAIKKGILCEFSYNALPFELTDEEKEKKRSIIAAYAARRKQGEHVNDEDMYRDLARVNKTSVSKLPLFQDYIQANPSMLDRCIIFVETKDYGIHVQRILIHDHPNFHTYYGDDDAENLQKFAKGELNCLITCKKISEGVDIKSVNNIILFSSDRGKLVTTQRIGRSLRTNPDNPDKRANIVDFICTNSGSNINGDTLSADMERMEWLTALSEVRRNENETV